MLMIQVHLMELFASPSVFESLTGKISLFMGAPPAAPVFMAAMGYFFARSQKSALQQIIRGFKLIGAGILLNTGMNAHLLIKIISGTFEINPWPYVFGVDILFLAGLSLITMAVFKTMAGNNLLLWIILLITAAAINPYLPVYTGSFTPIKYLQAFFWGYFWWSYFPLFPWLAYPVFGVVLFLVNKKFNLSKPDEKYRAMLAFLILIPLVIFFPDQFRVATNLEIYYHHRLPFFIWTSGFILIWGYFFHLITIIIRTSAVVGYIRWTGKHVTVFYVIQWLIIGNIATAIYKTQSISELAFWFAGILIATSALAWIYLHRMNFKGVFR